MMSLRRIIYTSKASNPMSRRDLLDMLHEARAFNSIDNITGVLMHRNGIFVQVIEGDPEHVGNLFASILRDPRHK